MKKPTYAIKFKNFCQNNNYSAKDIAIFLHVKPATVYKYWAGDIAVPDEAKKTLEQKIGLPIYDTFYNESFESEFITLKKSYLELLEKPFR